MLDPLSVSEYAVFHWSQQLQLWPSQNFLSF